mmetsp:Transcript_50454/g.141199  ORF Transcript_50454/g.141199 Transcript_50454/m.141199 type:complete len:272 (+) Transcript_50454:43-858(+)
MDVSLISPGHCPPAADAEDVDTGADAVGAELALAICQYFTLFELRVAAAVGQCWHRSAVACAVSAAGLSRTLNAFDETVEALEAGSLELCKLAVCSNSFDHQGFTLGLFVAADTHDVFPRASELLSSLPPAAAAYLHLPPATRFDAVASKAWRTWQLSEAPPVPIAEVRPTAGFLRRLWSSVYVLPDGDYDMHARELTFDLLRRWRALWWCARVSGPSSAGCANLVLAQRNEVRGHERWTACALVLRSSCGASSAAAVVLSYYDSDKSYVR